MIETGICSGNINLIISCNVSPISNGFVRVFAVGERSGHLVTEPPEPPELLQVLRAM